MKIAQSELGAAVNRLVPQARPAAMDGFPTKQSTVDADAALGRNVWFAFFIVVVIFSGIAAYFATPFACQMIVAAMWGILLGSLFVLFFPQKVAITLFGAAIGIFISNLSDSFKNVIALANNVDDKLNGYLGGEIIVYHSPILLFIVLFGICCFVAYFLEEPRAAHGR